MNQCKFEGCNIFLSNSAVDKILELKSKLNKNLLLSVKGGGCSGFEYLFQSSCDIFDIAKFTSSDSKKKLSLDEFKAVFGTIDNEKFSDFIKNYKGFCDEVKLGDDFEIKKDDLDITELNYTKISLFISKKSLGFIKNSIINFKSDLMGAKFEVINPNAVLNCSCGTSFDV